MVKHDWNTQHCTIFDWMKLPRAGMDYYTVDPDLLKLTRDIGSAILLDALMMYADNYTTNDGWIDMEAITGKKRVEIQQTWLWTAIRRSAQCHYIEIAQYSRFLENSRFEIRLTQQYYEAMTRLKVNAKQ